VTDGRNGMEEGRRKMKGGSEERTEGGEVNEVSEVNEGRREVKEGQKKMTEGSEANEEKKVK
jgi:hypothetical protein